MINSDNKILRQDEIQDYIDEIMAEENLGKRLSFFKELHQRAHKASQPYIFVYIRKTLNKIDDQKKLQREQMSLPF